MVEEQIKARGVRDKAVLEAMRRVPRHPFVPADLIAEAHADRPLPIGAGQTISQPYIVAYMTELLDVKPRHRVLEIGTGSGYQTAILAQLAARVYSIEIVEPLAKRAAGRLHALGIENIDLRIGDGGEGWPEEAPFDRILLTAAPAEIPPTLIEQLARGGRLVAPVGSQSERQSLIVIDKDSKGRLHRREDLPVLFVPMK